MQLFQIIREAVDHKKVMHYPSAMTLPQPIDFNIVCNQVLQRQYPVNKIKYDTNVGINHNDVFSHIFQIYRVETNPLFVDMHKHIVDNLPDFKIDRLDMFCSFKKSLGVDHEDKENSLILSLYKSTMYRFEDLDLTIELKPGDMLLSPTGTTHFSMSCQERIIVSWGLHK